MASYGENQDKPFRAKQKSLAASATAIVDATGMAYITVAVPAGATSVTTVKRTDENGANDSAEGNFTVPAGTVVRTPVDWPHYAIVAGTGAAIRYALG